MQILCTESRFCPLQRLTKSIIGIVILSCHGDQKLIYYNTRQRLRVEKERESINSIGLSFGQMSSQRPQHRPPSGQEDYDEGALSEEQQRKLNHKKVVVYLY